jgi:hypothetical protein
MATLTPAQIQSISSQLASIQAQANQVASSVNTLAQAQSAGMTVSPTTSVQQAQSYLGGTPTQPTPAPAPAPAQSTQNTQNISQQYIDNPYWLRPGETTEQYQARLVREVYPSAAGTQQDIPELPPTGDPVLDETLRAVNALLNKLITQGKTVNEVVEITPEKVAEFLAQAEREIDPFYAGQLKIAREYLLRSQNYSTEDIGLFEEDVERKYGKNLRAIGESAAEAGMALSGSRIKQERELAEDTQRAMDEQRRQISFDQANKAMQFAQEWGSADLSTPSMSLTPRVVAGKKDFEKPEGLSNLYTLNPDVYSNLKGTKQYEQEVAKRTRSSELESAWRTQEENKLRSLML